MCLAIAGHVHENGIHLSDYGRPCALVAAHHGQLHPNKWAGVKAANGLLILGSRCIRISSSDIIFGSLQERFKAGVSLPLRMLTGDRNLHGAVRPEFSERLSEDPRNQPNCGFSPLNWLVLVRESAPLVNVNWNGRIDLAQNDRPGFSRPVASSEFINNVRIDTGDIRQHDASILQRAKHLVANDPGVEPLVSTVRHKVPTLRQLHGLDRR